MTCLQTNALENGLETATLLLTLHLCGVLLRAHGCFASTRVLNQVCGSCSSASEKEGTGLTPNAHFPHIESDSQACLGRGVCELASQHLLHEVVLRPTREVSETET